jgi:hypothetical protein
MKVLNSHFITLSGFFMPGRVVLIPNREQGSHALTENIVIFSTGCDCLTLWRNCDKEGENIYAELHEEEEDTRV